MHPTTNAMPIPAESDYSLVLDDAYESGRADGIWIGAIGSPFVIALILALAWYLDL